MNPPRYNPPPDAAQQSGAASGYSAQSAAQSQGLGANSGPSTPFNGGYGYQQYQPPPQHQTSQQPQQPYQHQYQESQSPHHPPPSSLHTHQHQYSYGASQPPSYQQPYSQLPPPAAPCLPALSQNHQQASLPPAQAPSLPQHHQALPPVRHPSGPPLDHTIRGEEKALEPATSSQRDSISHQSLASVSRVEEATGRRYQLDVVQQPRRARMCGFGDKDRRPITPPPCVRLVITDIKTGKEVECNDIDHAMFVLNVDLWDAKGETEVNLVRSAQGPPPMAAGSSYPYSGLNGTDPGSNQFSQQPPPSSRDQPYTPTQGYNYSMEYQPPPQTAYQQVSPTYPPNGTYGPPTQYYPQHQEMASVQAPYGRSGSVSEYSQDQNGQGRLSVLGTAPTGMFSRNLIGSLAASAFRLSDTHDKLGIWFVLQDLSVRTEGSFRLRFSFVNVGPPSGPPRDEGGPKVNTGRAPILAASFSDVFTVYSAKKFPGVCESTPLSKTFATQGIKIPIRKDVNVRGDDADDGEY